MAERPGAERAAVVDPRLDADVEVVGDGVVEADAGRPDRLQRAGAGEQAD